jgi:hypothetical protein
MDVEERPAARVMNSTTTRLLNLLLRQPHPGWIPAMSSPHLRWRGGGPIKLHGCRTDILGPTRQAVIGTNYYVGPIDC